MMMPLFFVNPLAYFAMRAAAEARHAVFGIPESVHRGLMRAFYPL